MREFRQLPIDTIHESPNNHRRTFSDATLEELAASIRVRGVLKPVLVRPNGEGFLLIDGARRLRASRLAERADIPARIRDIDDNTAAEEMLIANLHHEDVPPLEEAGGYQQLLDTGRSIDELAVSVGKPKRYIYEKLSLNRLIPQAKDLVSRDILPLHYALKLATVPAERQEDGLARCFRPLFRDEPRRDQLEPLSELTTWIAKAVRLDPRSEDTSVLLPELAEQVAAVDQEEQATILALSTLPFHTDRTEPKPILAKSWKPAEGKARCAYARPGVIVLGDPQGAFVHACIAKKQCRKHWGKPKAAPSVPSAADKKAEEARQRREEEHAKQQADAEMWRAHLRPRVVRLVAERSSALQWSYPLLRAVLEEIRIDDLFLRLIGKPDKLPVRRYPQAIAVALALRNSWQREALLAFTRRLGIKVTAKAITDLAESIAPDAETPDASPDRPRTSSRKN